MKAKFEKGCIYCPRCNTLFDYEEHKTGETKRNERIEITEHMCPSCYCEFDLSRNGEIEIW